MVNRTLFVLAAVALVPACEGSPPPPVAVASSSAAREIASAVPGASVPDASASAPDAGTPVPSLVCATPCPSGTSCWLTSRGPACVACDPAALPTCKDDLTVAACKLDGTVETTDCARQRKRCLNGECRPRLCEPNRKHCHEDGNLYRCNATGTARVLIEDCGANTPPHLDGPVAVCQAGVSPPACRKKCTPAPGGDIIAMWGCSCVWDTVPFCSNSSDKDKSGCELRFCGTDFPGGWIGYAVGSGPCGRDTDGLAVPESERRGPCTGDGEFGLAKVDYQACRGGEAVAASRVVPCRK